MPNTHVGKQRLAKNTIFSLIAWFFPIIVGFVTTPILINGLGAEQYGILAIVLGFLSYSFTFGTGKAAAKFIPEYRAAGEDEKISDAVSATLWFSSSIAFVAALAVALLTSYIVSDILLIPLESQATARNAFYFACAIGMVMMIGQTFQNVLQGLHRFDSYVLLTNLSGLMLGAGNIILVVNGYGILHLLAWMLFTAVVVGLLFFLKSRQNLPELNIKLRVSAPVRNAVAKYGWNIILFQVFANILYIFERAWVTRKFGSQALTFYSVPMLLAIYMQGMIASFAQAIFPRINELLNEPDRLAALYQKATKIVLAVVTIICVGYITAGKSFLGLWVSDDLSKHSYSILVIHSLSFALIAVITISLQVAEAFRFSIMTAIITFCWMITAIPLMVLSADSLGSAGIALSRLTAVVITFPMIFFVEKRFFDRIFWAFWLSAAARLTAAALAAGFVAYQLFSMFAESWVMLTAGVIVCCLVYGAVLFFTGYFTREEKKIVRDLLGDLRVFSFKSDLQK